MTLTSVSYVAFLDPLQGKLICLLSEYVVFISLRQSCLLSLTLLQIGLCGAHSWER